MPPAAAAAIIPAVAGIGGSLLGRALSSGDQNAADNALQRALAEFQGLKVPELQNVKPDLQGETQMRNIDPRFQQAQLRALSSLQDIGEKGGMTTQDLANFTRFQNRANQQDQARRASILEQMQERGAGSSGAALAAQLANAQGTSQNMSDAGLGASGQASMRALQAIQGAGGLGSQLWRQGAESARAQDLINQFNTMAKNQAQYWNVQNPQRQFEMGLQKASGMLAPSQALANQKMGEAAGTQQLWGGIGNAAGTLGGMAAGGYFGGGGGGGGNSVPDQSGRVDWQGYTDQGWT